LSDDNNEGKLQKLMSKADSIIAKIKALQAELDNVTAEANSVKQFIALGTPTTIDLGQAERAKVVANYQIVYKKIPDSQDEWEDVLKIANGQRPDERNLAKEREAQKSFRKLVKRAPDFSKPADDAAISYIAYGIRPETRDLKAESAAVKIFRSSFGKNPKTEQDWNVVRAAAYTGVKK
jgi:hypothetical protein